MTTIPQKPGKTKLIELPKLAVTATLASKSDAGFNIGPGGAIDGWLYAHVTDAQGLELSPDKQPRPEHFQLFELSSTSSLRPVQLYFPSIDVEKTGALQDVVHQFYFTHTPDFSNPVAGQLRQVPFMLVVSPAGTGIAALANSAGTTLLSAVVLIDYVMQIRGGGIWGA